jgi:hypothetical protein
MTHTTHAACTQSKEGIRSVVLGLKGLLMEDNALYDYVSTSPESCVCPANPRKFSRGILKQCEWFPHANV